MRCEAVVKIYRYFIAQTQRESGREKVIIVGNSIRALNIFFHKCNKINKRLKTRKFLLMGLLNKKHDLLSLHLNRVGE